METRVDDSWHLKKEFNVGHFLTTLVLLISLTVYAIKVDQRITVTEVRMEALQDTVRVERDIQREANREVVQELRLLRSDIATLNQRLAEERQERPNERN